MNISKKLIAIIVAVVLVIVLVVMVTISGAGNSCSQSSSATNSSNDPINEPVDESKYQLNVSTYDGGYGYEWLIAAKTRYEQIHENDVYENGKRGIQVRINPVKEKAGALVDSVLGGPDDVYFTEFAYYYQLFAEGILGDITEAVEGDLSVYDQGDAVGTTIKDKLTEQQEAYYNIDGKYYGIPHYAGYYGLVYNRRLFNNNDWYFAKNPKGTSLQGKFITDTNPTKSDGPDGIAGTYDDGLPATYEEFFWLCDWIDEGNETAVQLNGIDYKSYVNGLTNALAVDYSGLEQSLLNYTFNGTATSLATINSKNQIVLDKQPTVISEANGYELTRQAGKAYALQFAEKLLTNNNYAYMNSDFDSPSHSHINAQRDFVRSEMEGACAMLIEGIWWQSEATKAFSDATFEFGQDYSKKNSDFAWMPLPKATKDQVGQGITLYDSINSMCFMKNGITGEKRDIAIDFIKFCNTNESLVEFTQITDTPKALNYTLTDDELKALTPFAKSLLNIKNQPTTKIVYPQATSAFYQTNQRMILETFYARLDGANYLHAAETFIRTENRKSFSDYFTGMYTYRQSEWQNWLDNVAKS